MATSGSYNFNMTAADIIQEALEYLGVAGVGATISSEDQASCLRTLNAMVKNMQTEGIGLWKARELTLFPGHEEYSFDIGPSGDHCSMAGYKTEIATAAASGAGTITVDSDDNITNGDYIGIELDDGTLQWTTVNGVPAANVVTLTAVLTDTVSVDNHVYNYTSKTQRPVEIIEARIVDSDTSEIQIGIISRDEYKGLSNKTEVGTPTQVYYDPQLTNGKLYVWPAVDDVKQYLKLEVKIPIEDFDAAANDPDFPQEWFLALSHNLAVLVAPKFGKPIDNNFLARAEMLKDRLRGTDTENASLYFGAKSWR